MESCLRTGTNLNHVHECKALVATDRELINIIKIVSILLEDRVGKELEHEYWKHQE